MTGFISYKIKISAFVIGLIFFLHTAGAQTLQQAQHFWDTKELPAAAEQIQKYTTTNPAVIEGWILKAKIYTAISNDAGLRYLTSDARMEAFNSLEKALKLDKTFLEKQLRTDSFTLPFQLYNGYIDYGISIFNSGIETQDKQIFNTAFSTFKKAALVGNLIYTNGWGLSALDTTVTFYLAKAAIQAGKEEEAAFYIRKLTDAGITESKDHKDFETLYKWLVYYYRVTGNVTELEKYTAIETAAFPLSEYFPKNYIDWLREQKDYKRLCQAYEDIFAKGFNNAENHYMYALDLFNYLYGTDEVTERAYYENKLLVLLTAYTQQNPQVLKGKLLAAKFYINQAADLQKALLKQPADPEISKVYKASINDKINTANKYLLDIAGSKTADKKLYNEAVQLLVADYKMLKKPALANKYKKLYR